MPMLRAILIYGFVALYGLIAAPTGMIWALWTGRTDHLFRLARFCMRTAFRMGGIRIAVEGLSLIDPDRNYLFLSNHQGNLDGPLLYIATRRNLRAVIKQELMRIPLLSPVLKKVDFVPVDRSDPIRAHASVDRAAELLQSGLSFFAFPEGTRSRDGRLGIFKKGVFVMAIKSGVPIVPVTIHNSRDIQPPGSFALRAATVNISFHEPIETRHLDLKDRQDLLERTRAAISGDLEKKRQESAESSP
jgi:1-acyl-sn-glycerol-3-phosphate acyltransferase